MTTNAQLTSAGVELWGYNKHIWDVGAGMFVTLRKGAFTGYLLYIVGGGLIKISILLFYQRLDARSISRGFRYVTWVIYLTADFSRLH